MDRLDLALLTAQLVATSVMVGVIWFVQVVHYPLFARVGPDGFAAYEAEHRRRTSFVVGPPMVVELLVAVALVVDPPTALGRGLPWLGLAVLCVVHVSTVGLQVPAHDRLSGGYDAETAARLVRTNWVRTIGWAARLVLAIAMLVVVPR
jgi:uncharacterized membrane protein